MAKKIKDMLQKKGDYAGTGRSLKARLLTVEEEIRMLYEEIRGLFIDSLDRAIRIGELLAQKKAQLQHGEWSLWIDANLPFTDRTARRYMWVYENREALKRTPVSDLTEAYRLLESPSQSKKPIFGTLPEDFKVTFKRDSLYLETEDEVSCRILSFNRELFKSDLFQSEQLADRFAGRIEAAIRAFFREIERKGQNR